MDKKNESPKQFTYNHNKSHTVPLQSDKKHTNVNPIKIHILPQYPHF